MADPNKNQILFPGIVVDDTDPMCLGRIRIQPQTELVNYPVEILNFYNKVDTGIYKFEKWGKDDPFVFLPLLPIYFYHVPKKNEYVSILYQDKDYRRENQFYIPGPISSPMNIKFEYFAGAITYLGQGSFNKTFKPLKDFNNQYRDVKSFGIFPEPGDIAIMGRGSTDLILKENEVLLRAGKTQTKDLNPIKFPIGSEKRAFVQLSNFVQTQVPGKPQSIQTQKANVQYVKKMIMWEIFDLTNSENMLTGRISLYNLKESSSVTTANFKLGSIVDLKVGEDYTSPLIFFDFFGKSINEVAELINLIAESLFKGIYRVPDYDINEDAKQIFSQSDSNQTLPFVITPHPNTYKLGFQNQNTTGINEAQELANYLAISILINVRQRASKFGFLLVSSKSGDGKTPIIGQNFTTKNETIVNSNYFASPITYGSLGAQKLYLLSHDSEGPKGKVDLKNTLYGIPQKRFVDDFDSIEKLTYPMVRGDKIIELLEKIIQYLTTHVHPFFGMPPVPSPVLEDVLKTVADAPNTILNQNIRIN